MSHGLIRRHNTTTFLFMFETIAKCKIYYDYEANGCFVLVLIRKCAFVYACVYICVCVCGCVCLDRLNIVMLLYYDIKNCFRRRTNIYSRMHAYTQYTRKHCLPKRLYGFIFNRIEKPDSRQLSGLMQSKTMDDSKTYIYGCVRSFLYTDRDGIS